MNKEDKNRQETDRLLLELIKDVDLEKPSSHLIDEIVVRYSSQAKLTAFRRAKLPIFLLGLLFILLFLPMLIAAWTEIGLYNPSLNIMEEISFELSFWYLVFPIFLLLSLMLIVQLELHIIFHPNSKDSNL